MKCVVEIWQPVAGKTPHEKAEWKLLETWTPLRLGKPLPLIPFVFHGPRNFLPDVDKLPLGDVIAVNLDQPGQQRRRVAVACDAVGVLVELDGGLAE